MSLITRCPACATMFKLVTDQLRVSGGWVRCGSCNKVFDASTHLIPYQESVQAMRRAVPPPATPSPRPSASADTDAQAPQGEVNETAEAAPAGTDAAPPAAVAPEGELSPESERQAEGAQDSAPEPPTDQDGDEGAEEAEPPVPQWEPTQPASWFTALEEDGPQAPVTLHDELLEFDLVDGRPLPPEAGSGVDWELSPSIIEEPADTDAPAVPAPDAPPVSEQVSEDQDPDSSEESADADEAEGDSAAEAEAEAKAKLEPEPEPETPASEAPAEEADESEANPRQRLTFTPWTASELQAWREARAARGANGRSDSEAPAPADVASAEPSTGEAGESQEATAENAAAEPAEPPAPADAPAATADVAQDEGAEPADGAAAGEADAPASSSSVDFLLSDIGRPLLPSLPPAPAQAPDAAAAEAAKARAKSKPAKSKSGAAAQDAKLDQLSFVAAARRRAFWSSKPMRMALWGGALLLALLLVAQMLVSRRDVLAARNPGWTPFLQALCAPVGCSIQPYRQLDAVVIDNSSFKRSGPAAFHFSVTLRNQMDMPIATPALELTLTDAADQAVVRRIISAAELGAPPAIDARGEFSSAKALSLSGLDNPGDISGYRLVAFYP